jgi:hypothetical protein
MNTIAEIVTGDLIVKENTTFHHVLVESVIVENGVTARLYGSVRKEIIVKTDAIAYLHGNLLGNVNNQGGTVYVFKPNGKIEGHEPISLTSR